MMALALIENLQREDLNPIEEARAYQRLAEEEGLTQAEIARMVALQLGRRAPRCRWLELAWLIILRCRIRIVIVSRDLVSRWIDLSEFLTPLPS